VSRLKADALVAAEVAGLEAQMRTRVVESVAEWLTADAPRTLRFLANLRDGRLDRLGGPLDPATLHARTRAASVLTLVPKPNTPS
jgi:hypothetical protein